MRSVLRRWLSRVGTPRRATRLIAGLTLALLAVQTATVIVVEGPAALLDARILPGVVMHAAFVVAVAAGAIRLRRGGIDADRYPRLVGWYLGGFAGFLSINLALIAFFPADRLVENASWALFAGTMGAGTGLLVGWVEARAIDRAVAAERDAAEAEFLAAQRDRFEYLNALLRHEVLNNVQVIRGQAEYVLDDDPDPELADHLEVISRQSEDMAAVIEDVRLISQGLESPDLEPVDLEVVLQAELTDLRDAHEAVETDLSCPEGVHVRADGLLPRVFSNLLANAVEHNDADVPAVTVDVAVEDEWVVVRVADNGSGVPPEVEKSLFDRTRGPHGIGLYLVDTLVTHYGGRVELTESGADGSVFTVELERAADTEPDGADAHGAFDAATSVVSDDED